MRPYCKVLPEPISSLDFKMLTKINKSHIWYISMHIAKECLEQNGAMKLQGHRSTPRECMDIYMYTYTLGKSVWHMHEY